MGDGLRLLVGMRQHRHQLEVIEPNLTTCSVVASACRKGTRPDRALNPLEELRNNHFKPDVIIHSAVISACEKGQ